MEKGAEGLENWTIFMDVICIIPNIVTKFGNDP